ncbi:MAG: four helix bundle protein [Candidatus Omnitrophica bacterium]|nr:four helix bundle protein [Candidatus Omnitrophota bacterium]
MSNLPMTNEITMTQIPNRKYDLRERTAKFGENIVNFAKSIPENSVNRPLISQLVRAGTSVGANYCEADDASTRKDFFYKIGTCRRESKESKHWLRMITTAVPSLKAEAELFLNEAQELNLIFSAIINRAGKR